jgi:PAS domain S-box-containing protein
VDLLSQSLFVAIIVGLIGAGFVSATLLAKSRAWIRFVARRFSWFRTAQSVMEILPEAIVGVDRRGTVRSLNEPAERLFGYRETDVLGRSISLLIRGATAFRTGQKAPRDSAAWASPADCGISTDAIARDGRSFPVVCFPLRLNTRRGQFYVLVRDESHCLRESDLQKRCECLTSALQLFPAPLLIVHRTGRVLMFSQACEAVFGSALRMGTNLHALFPDAPLRTMLSGEMENGNMVRLPDSRSGHLFKTLSIGDGRVPDYVVLMGESPDAVVRTETQAAAMRRLEDLMTEIGGFSELLLSGTRPDDPMHEDLAHVNRASRMAITALQALAGRSNGHAARQNTSV